MPPRVLADLTRRLLNGPRTSQKLRDVAIIERLIEKGEPNLTDEMVAALLAMDPGESPESVVNAIATLVISARGKGFAEGGLPSLEGAKIR